MSSSRVTYQVHFGGLDYLESTLAYSAEFDTTRLEIVTGHGISQREQRIELDGDYRVAFHNFLHALGYKPV